MGWEEQLWAEINSLEKTDQIVAAGNVITRLTRVVLPQLGDHRRVITMELIENGTYKSRQLAEMIGTTPTTVVRLLEEGRRKRRLIGGSKDNAA